MKGTHIKDGGTVKRHHLQYHTVGDMSVPGDDIYKCDSCGYEGTEQDKEFGLTDAEIPEIINASPVKGVSVTSEIDQEKKHYITINNGGVAIAHLTADQAEELGKYLLNISRRNVDTKDQTKVE